jgi:GT2 family glycosyltransferase
MCDLVNKFTGAWKGYGSKHGLDTDKQCLEHAIRASVILVDADNSTVFDWRRYLQDHPDVQRRLELNMKNITYSDVTCHYLNHGLSENRKAYVLGTNQPYIYDFDWKMYDELNPDVFTQRNRGDNIGKWHCFRHWCEFGHVQNRKTTSEKQIASVNTDAVISTDDNVNQSWLRGLSYILNKFKCKTIEDLITHAYLPIYDPDKISNIINPVKLSIVILCFNQLEYTKQCIESVLQNTICDYYEVVVVNNGSSDGTVEYLELLRGKHANIKIVNNSENLGFSKGMNIGVRNSSGEYIILLNNDTIVDINWDYNLVDLLRNDASIFVVTPSTNCCRNEARFEIVHSTPKEYFTKYNSVRDKFISHFIASSLMLFCGCFRRKDFEQIGYLDESYLNGWEDDDLYERIIISRKHVCISTQSSVYNFGSTTVGNNMSNNPNRLRYEKKWNKKWETKHNIRFDRSYNLSNLTFLADYKFYDNNSLFFKSIIAEFKEFYKNLDINIQTTNRIEEKIIIFNLFDIPDDKIPCDFIAFNLEQLQWERENIVNQRNIIKFRKAKLILDYSLLNFKSWFKYDIYNVVFHPEPIFYANTNTNTNIDVYEKNVIFYGELTERRMNKIDYLNLYNKIYYSQTLFGEKKNELLNKNRLILDISSFENSIKNMLRISESFKHNCLIVSENGIDEYYNNLYNDLCYSFIDIYEANQKITEIKNMPIELIISILNKNKLLAKLKNNRLLHNIIESSKIIKHLNSYNPIITFIMPSINHPDICNAIKSVLSQTIQNWKLIIVFDCVDSELINIPLDPRITSINLKQKLGSKKTNGNAGLVRNEAYKFVSSEWIGYIDDDDCLGNTYISDLLDEIELKKDIECVLFRFFYRDHLWGDPRRSPNGKSYNYVPQNGVNNIVKNQAPISFCHKNFNLDFTSDDCEDYFYLNSIKTMGKKMCISPKVTYFVKQDFPEEISPNFNRSYINC